MSQTADDPHNPLLPPWCSVKEALEARDLLDVATEVAKERHVLVREVLGKRRTRSVVAARHELWRTLRRRGLSSTEIADVFGVDHTSVLYAWKSVPG